MGWAYDSAAGGWTLSASSGRAALVAGVGLGAAASVLAELQDPYIPVRILIQCSPRGDTGFEIGVDELNITIWRWEYGERVGTVLASAAHGLSFGVGYTIEVRRIGTQISVYLNGATSAVVSYTNSSGYFAELDGFGFVADTDGAMVTRFQRCGVTEVRASREEVGVVVSGGDVYLVRGARKSLVARGAFGATADIWAIEGQDQKLYMGDGSVAKVVDPTADDPDEVVMPLIPSAGGLPGQTAADGSCTATVATVYFSRSALAGADSDPQNIYLSRVGDFTDWDTAADESDRAYGADSDRSRVGQPVTALKQAATGVLVIGTTGQLWKLIGDPSRSIPQLQPIHDGGCHGPEAMLLADEGLVVALGAEGLILVPAAGDAIPLSRDVLTEGLNLTPTEALARRVILARDPQRQITYVFLTPRGSGQGTHFAYHERVGRWTPGQGGFQPLTFADEDLEPTAASVVDSELLIGTRDGRLLRFDESEKDDDGDAIDCNIPVALFDEPYPNGGDADTILDRLLVQLALAPVASDDAALRVYAGRTPEEAYLGASRWLVLSDTATSSPRTIRRGVRGPCLVLEVSNDQADESIDIETVETMTRAGRLTRRGPRTVATLDTPCPPPTAAGSNSDTFGSGVGGGGSTPSGSCVTIDVGAGGDAVSFGDDSAVYLVFRGCCIDPETGEVSGTIERVWRFENPSESSGVVTWTYSAGGNDSTIEYTATGRTWSYSIHASHVAFVTPSCGGLTPLSFNAPTNITDKSNSMPATSGSEQFFLYADATLDNGCAGAIGLDEATGFWDYYQASLVGE